MTVHDPGKLAVLLLVLVGGFVLVLTDTDATAGVGMVTAVLGYVTGNGVLAARRNPPSTALAPKLRPVEYAETLEEVRAVARAQLAVEMDARTEHPPA